MVTRCQRQSFAPLEWWQRLLRVQRVNGLDHGTRPLNCSHLGETASGVKVHPGEAVESVLELRDETLRIRSKLVLFVKNLTIESRL